MAQPTMTLAGSGSSIAGQLLGVWDKKFHETHPAIQVGYVATSSGEGLQELSHLQGDFSISEMPWLGKPGSGANSGLVRLPVAVFSVTPVYNLPGRPHLRFTGELLALIYMGRVANWHSQLVQQQNPGVTLPDLPITVLQRPGDTGSRYVFTEFLAKSSPEFRKWSKSRHAAVPGEIVIARSKGLAEKVAATPGAIGFVDFQMAVEGGLRCGEVRNAAGQFVDASMESINAASAAMQDLVFADAPGPPLNARGEKSYPLTGFSWVYLSTRMPAERKDGLYEFLNWCLGDGQFLIEGNAYDRLPPAVASKARAQLAAVLHHAR